jgi:hypothetical protein
VVEKARVCQQKLPVTRLKKNNAAASKPISLDPLKFNEVVSDLLKVKPPAKPPKNKKSKKSKH